MYTFNRYPAVRSCITFFKSKLKLLLQNNEIITQGQVDKGIEIR